MAPWIHSTALLTICTVPVLLSVLLPVPSRVLELLAITMAALFEEDSVPPVIPALCRYTLPPLAEIVPPTLLTPTFSIHNPPAPVASIRPWLVIVWLVARM